MGSRGDRGRPWTIYEDRGVAFINTRIAGKRIRESLGIEFDLATASPSLRREVEQAAAKRYADLVSGRVLKRDEGARVLTSHTLKEVMAMYLVEARLLFPKGFKTREIQLRNAFDWAEHAKRFLDDRRASIERLFSDNGPHLYAIDRLQAVTRSTVNKETSALFGFLDWAVREKKLTGLPTRPRLPRGNAGTRSGPQRPEPVEITHDEAIAICNAMPEYTSRTSKKTRLLIVVRDFARFLYETGLRPGAVQRIQVPRDWQKGSVKLRVHADEDKALYGREVYLTKVAIEILERNASTGRVFGVHDLREYFKAAALKVLPIEKASAFARYDLRHGAARIGLAVSGNLLGVAHQLGHRRITTTNHYLRASEQHGAAVVKALDAVSGRSAEAFSGADSACASSDEKCLNNRVVRRRGLEPLRFYSLAPQGSRTCKSSGEFKKDKRQSTSKVAAKATRADRERSAVGQQGEFCAPLIELDRALSFEMAMWDSFDAFSASASAEDWE